MEICEICGYGDSKQEGVICESCLLRYIVKKEYITPYAYLCKECCVIAEIPCFVEGKCPECGSECKDVLYLETEIHGKKKN